MVNSETPNNNDTNTYNIGNLAKQYNPVSHIPHTVTLQNISNKINEIFQDNLSKEGRNMLWAMWKEWTCKCDWEKITVMYQGGESVYEKELSIKDFFDIDTWTNEDNYKKSFINIQKFCEDNTIIMYNEAPNQDHGIN